MTTAFCPSENRIGAFQTVKPSSLATNKCYSSQFAPNLMDSFAPMQKPDASVIKKEVKKQMYLQELKTKYQNKEIGFMEYAIKSAIVNLGNVVPYNTLNEQSTEGIVLKSKFCCSGGTPA